MRSFCHVEFCLLLFAAIASAQVHTRNCFRIEHREFFGIGEDQKIKWSNTELSQLIDTVNKSSSLRETRWLIPIVAFQLEDFDPVCGSSTDSDRLEKLIALYEKVRGIDDTRSNKNRAVAARLNLVRSDFYGLLRSDSDLAEMIYTTDDGPLVGIVRKSVPKMARSKLIPTSFGKVTVGNLDGKVFVSAIDRKNKVLWCRVLRGDNPERYLQKADLRKSNVQNTSLGPIVSFYVDGEKLTLYTRPDGRFLFYFHSW